MNFYTSLNVNVCRFFRKNALSRLFVKGEKAKNNDFDFKQQITLLEEKQKKNLGTSLYQLPIQIYSNIKYSDAI